MKLKVTRSTKRQIDARTFEDVSAGLYKVPAEVSQELADAVVRLRHGYWVKVKKKAPENKLAKAPKSKTGVAAPAKRRSRTRAKPKS